VQERSSWMGGLSVSCVCHVCHVVQLKAETLELVQELLHQNGSLSHHLLPHT
jgi:hypothetical protein